MSPRSIKISLLIALINCLVVCIARAQNLPVNKRDSLLSEVDIKSKAKLPNVQKISLRAPSDLQIDGNSTEWKSQFRAYNHAIRLFYTIANDDNNVYLFIQGTDKRIINKMMEGGISFTINALRKKDDDNDKNVIVLFPLMSMVNCRIILHEAGKTIDDNPAGFSMAMSETTRLALADDRVLITKANEDLTKNEKYIKIAGVPAITDLVDETKPGDYGYLPLRFHSSLKLIPIANHDDIKVLTHFDDRGRYNYELAMPIKYMGLLPAEQQKFTYNIKLNARWTDKRIGDLLSWDTHKQMYNGDLETPTDFWAEYTLAK